MTKKFYFGGGFNFSYSSLYDDSNVIAHDYRGLLFTKLGKDPMLLLGNIHDNYDNNVHISSNSIYIGPFYFYNKHGLSEQESVVLAEAISIEKCTDAVFFIQSDNIPGTITEMIHAAMLGKNIHIFYVNDFDNSIDGDIKSKCWYPLIFCQHHTITRVTQVQGIEDAVNNIVELIK